MELAEPDSKEDRRAVGDIVRRSMRASYSLSPEQINAVIEEEFTDDALAEKAEADDVVQVVARQEGEVIGFAEGTSNDATVRWLQVAPEVRGEGTGTELFKRLTDELRDRGGDDLRATTLQANQEGHAFFEKFGYEEVGEREVEIGDQSLVEYVFAAEADEVGKSARASSEEATETEAAGGSASDEGVDPDKESWAETDFPETEERDGHLVATTDDGEEVYVDRDEPQTGREAPFFPAYNDADFEDRYGFYCGNCGSLDVLIDEMSRTECNNCGNVHAAKEGYDSSYL